MKEKSFYYMSNDLSIFKIMQKRIVQLIYFADYFI